MIVATSSGEVEGFWRGASAAFLGVPFAAPPVGEYRFAAPQPHPGWSGVRPATSFGATPQRRPFGLETTIPEPSVPGDSTLNVNVYTPAPGDPHAGLPVLVWIHGGGFFAGSPASPWYDGIAFNRDGVVTVSVSYRLGFDGFGWIEDAPDNRGLLDQIAALEWVRENIEAFGGDPDRVTIAGQSAGGSSVLSLLAVPRAEPLFAAAIVQSGALRDRSLSTAEEMGSRFAHVMGVPPTRAGWAELSEDAILDGQSRFYSLVAEESGSTPTERVHNVVAGDVAGWLPFVPHTDADLSPVPISEALLAGANSNKPVLMGATAHEFTMVMASLQKQLSGCDKQEVLRESGLVPAAAVTLMDSFPYFDASHLLGQVMTEYMFRIPLLDAAEKRLAGSGADTWLYDFRWQSPKDGLSAHCYELPFVWDLLDAEGVSRSLGSTPPRHLADEMHSHWVEFVAEGDPGWSRISTTSQTAMVFDDEVGTGDSLKLERRLAELTR